MANVFWRRWLKLGKRQQNPKKKTKKKQGETEEKHGRTVEPKQKRKITADEDDEQKGTSGGQ